MIYVMLGGAIGALGRYLASNLVLRVYPGSFPFHTMAVNVFGCFLMGVWIATMTSLLPGKAKDLHLLLAVGALGGFTTFSAFSLEIFLLIERGQMTQALAYAVGSVAMSLAALVGGLLLTRMLAG